MLLESKGGVCGEDSESEEDCEQVVQRLHVGGIAGHEARTEKNDVAEFVSEHRYERHGILQLGFVDGNVRPFGRIVMVETRGSRSLTVGKRSEIERNFVRGCE